MEEIIELLKEVDWLLFFHLAGIIIGLGAVTVIDTLGFVSRKSKKWTQTTIEAHHVTKPLIWLGTIIVLATWIFMFENNSVSIAKTIILSILILNGIFLSSYISPRLDKLSGKNKLLPSHIQAKITGSFIISFTGWWLFVLLTVVSVRAVGV